MAEPHFLIFAPSACSGPSGLQPKGNLSFTFTTLDASGQAAQAPSGHECWLESVAGVSTASYSPCTTPITLPADIQVSGCPTAGLACHLRCCAFCALQEGP
jgi:hypothetical protein